MGRPAFENGYAAVAVHPRDEAEADFLRGLTEFYQQFARRDDLNSKGLFQRQQVVIA
jgi:hypothetical protein